MNDNRDQRETDAATLKRERLKAARTTRTSTTVVAIMLLAIFGYCALEFAAQRSPLAIQAVFLMAFLGVALFFLEPRVRFQRANEFRILRFYKSPRFYGTVISASAVLVLALTFLLAPAPQVPVRARVAPAVVRPVLVPELPEPPKPPEFPPLAISGVIINGKKSSALVNGKTLHIGEHIGDVQIVDVQEGGVVGELRGYRRFFARENFAAKPSFGTPAPRR